MLSAEGTMIAGLNAPVPDSSEVTVRDVAEWIESGRSLLLLRFSDGEFYSMFHTGRFRSINADGHRYLWDTLGAELRRAFHESLEASVAQPGIRVWVSDCWSEFKALKEYIEALPVEKRRAMLHGNFWIDAIRDGTIFGLLDTIRAWSGRKILLSKAEDAPVAEALGASLVACPSPNVYLSLDAIEAETAKAIAGERSMVLSCIGMPSECILWRLWRGDGLFIDFGHVPDAMMGRTVRRYLRRGGMGASTRTRFLEWAVEG